MFAAQEFDARRSRLLQTMQAERLDTLLIYSAKPESGYVRYYTGWESELGIYDCSLLAVTPGYGNEWTLLTNAFWDEPFNPRLQTSIVTGDLGSALREHLPKGTRRIGVAPLRQFPASIYRQLLTACPKAEITDARDLLLKLRAVKSLAEIEILRRTAAVADASVAALQQVLQPGVSELEAAAEVERALRRAGSGPLIFSTIVCSGERTGRFIALPTSRRFENGDLVQLDCGPSIDGYHGDFSRCATAGEPSSAARKLMEDTATLYEVCLAALRPGVRACDVARKVLETAGAMGYGPEHLYQSPNVKPGFVGHGIGLANPDVPQLSPQDDTELECGMVINIETILKNPALGSTRLEDAVVIEPGAPARLSQSSIRLWETA
jgi:Xaa-Pro aminopeptidase